MMSEIKKMTTVIITMLVLMVVPNLYAQILPRSTTAKKVNVLFIAVDDLRNQLGCYGDSVIITPNIDRLAKNGIVFNNAYCQQAVCGPSRASLLTGRRPDVTKVWDLETHFRKALPNAVTLPQYFKENGYQSLCVGKIYHDPAASQDSISWSAPEIMAVTGTVGHKYVLKKNSKAKGKAAAVECVNVPDSAYVDGMVCNAAIKVLREIKDKPFFLAVGFRRPHLPFTAPKKYWDYYKRDEIPMPKQPAPPQNVPEIALHNSTELRGYTDVPDEGPIPPDKIRQLRHGYYASVTYTDMQIGRLLDELNKQGLMDNTIIVLWSDHGYHLGELGLWCKSTNFESDTRIPLIISAPNIKNKGVYTDGIVESVDLYPTLAQLAGLSIPDELDGLSMVPLMEAPERPWKKAAFSQFPRPWMYKNLPRVMGYSVRTKDFRYTEWRNFKNGTIEFTELYRYQANGRLEEKNLAAMKQYDNIKITLKQLLDDGWQKALPVKNR
ncbi:MULTISPECIES: sulfatase [Olivibacter]|jgi:iduronate 2-sulfatase|uniref:Sulfatase n=1 Tax=Olivibacter oleidegradans TaxID=760123 RepID=A0ABV6HPZ3_9SPHI|nr:MULTISPECIES: sulfatase [Olivibacter]MDM8173872.1 sulfatase [Olivibacter sp. 47]MDX3915055.1 sulfatase [Pseudosphingobacterium sp.]